jgi:hypothetical protein
LPPLYGVGANSIHFRYKFAGLSDRFRVIAWIAPGCVLVDNRAVEAPEGGIMPTPWWISWTRPGLGTATRRPIRC